MQADSPTILANSAFRFGIYAATAKISENFIPKDVLTVYEAWQNVNKEMVSPYTD